MNFNASCKEQGNMTRQKISFDKVSPVGWCLLSLLPPALAALLHICPPGQPGVGPDTSRITALCPLQGRWLCLSIKVKLKEENQAQYKS